MSQRLSHRTFICDICNIDFGSKRGLNLHTDDAILFLSSLNTSEWHQT